MLHEHCEIIFIFSYCVLMSVMFKVWTWPFASWRHWWRWLQCHWCKTLFVFLVIPVHNCSMFVIIEAHIDFAIVTMDFIEMLKGC